MAVKLPSLQFYPGDWRKDPGVQSLDYESRGIWFEILMIMFESSERGKLILNGLPMPEDALARLLGIDVAKVQQTLSKLLAYGVASICQNTGALVNRRMLKDEEFRRYRAGAGALGGKQKAINASSKRLANPTPSSSSSSSSSKKIKTLVPIAFEAEDDWLKKFLESTRLIEFRDGERQSLMDPKWWENQSIACNGIDLQFLESEFAKMGRWLFQNKQRRPTKRFVSNWLDRASERRKEYGG